MDESHLASAGAEGAFLRQVLDEVKRERKESKNTFPKNYELGTFWRRAQDPFFILRKEAQLGAPIGDFGAQRVGAYLCDVYLWIPELLVPHDQPLVCPSCESKLFTGGARPRERRRK